MLYLSIFVLPGNFCLFFLSFLLEMTRLTTVASPCSQDSSWTARCYGNAYKDKTELNRT
jgi:hypothetical protein